MDKVDKLLVALRTRINQLFEVCLEGIGSEEEDEESIVESYSLIEEFILKDGKKIRVTDCESLQQVILFEGDKRVLMKRAMAGYVIEASEGHYTANRILTDGTVHLPLQERERQILTWAFETIRWFVQNAPAILGE